MKGLYFSRSLETTKLKLIIDNISIYRNIINDEVIGSLYDLMKYMDNKNIDLDKFIKKYNEFFFKFVSTSHTSLKDYIIDKIMFDENPYSMKASSEKGTNIEEFIESATKNDLFNLKLLSEISPKIIKKNIIRYFKESEFETNIIKRLPEWQTKSSINEDIYTEYMREIRNKFLTNEDWTNCFDDLTNFHRQYGCGMFARYKAFTWESLLESSSLRGIENPDPTKILDLIGYELEREIIVENTVQFLNSFPANNMLLYGDKGTGKSATVKALLSEYHKDGLRIVEVSKEHLTAFTDIIRILKNRPQKFILFIDDLTFEDGEIGYASLKAILEGSLESKPKNVLIYATSNRRHLVKEYFHERKGLMSGNHNEEIHASDSIQEKLSLADRFGITVVFSAPNQDEYLKIVEGLADKRRLKIDKEELRSQALTWEKRHNGRSARTARQFVDWLEGHLKIK